ncbi:MAG: alpha/beta fold hydrolase [Anaeroplasmataceae bacterium]|nr:alpha/beta fold hydrolase [Anaeroplasmataceae bacterium]
MIYNRHDVIRIIAKILNCPETELKDESGLTRTYNWDSLKHIIILTSLESYFEIEIGDEAFSTLTTMNKIFNYLDLYNLETCVESGKCICETPCYFEHSYIIDGYDEIKLAGIYCFTSQKPKGFVLFSHGIPSEKDEAGLHKNIAAYLAKRGFDSFRFDFRYMGESTKGDETLLSIDNLMQDLECAYNFALKNPSIDIIKRRHNSISNQFVIGTSCGGGILLKWINDFNHANQINKVFLCCPVLDYMYECTGISKENIIGKEKQILEGIRQLGYIDGRDVKYGKYFFQNALHFSIDAEIEQYGKQVVIFHGNHDQFVPYQISQKVYENHSSIVDLIEVDRTRHGFGVLLVDKYGIQIPNNERYKLKMKYQSDIIHSIYCSIKGVQNDGNN